MSRVLLADDSPHAQRIGEFILREEGFEIVSVTDGATAIVRLADVDPDLVLADVNLPQRSGYDLCRHIKDHPGHRHVKVVLTAGAQEPIDEVEAAKVRCDGILHKPFEASVMSEMAKRLVEEARQARLAGQAAAPEVETGSAAAAPAFVGSPKDAAVEEAPPAPAAIVPEGSKPPEREESASPVEDTTAGIPESAATIPSQPAVIARIAPSPDPETVRAAVTLALEIAMPVLIDEITQRVMLALEEGDILQHSPDAQAPGESA